MPILILITAVLSVLIAFLSAFVKSGNAFLAYYVVLWIFFLTNWLYVTVGFVIACVFFLATLKIEKKFSQSRLYLLAAFQVAASCFIGTFAGFIVLGCIAWVELNALALIIDINPSFLGITSDIPHIVASLKINDTAPQIVASDMDNYQELLGVATTTTGTTNVYGSAILTSIPSLLVLPIIQPPSSMLLIDNTLIITAIKKADLETISPIIGNLLVQEYFPTRKIRAYPKVSILTSAQFAKARNGEYQEKFAKIDEELQTITQDISSISASIQLDNNNILTAQNTIDQATSQNEDQYTACINAGYYLGNTYIHYHTKDYCQGILDSTQTVQLPANNDLDTWKKQLVYDQEELQSYQYYQKFFTTQKQLMQLTKANIPLELGLFVPPNTLQIVIDQSQTHDIANYFELLTHEYFHYASYIPGKQFKSSLFEEGLTEYFARQAIHDTFNVDVNLGYPVYVKIISQMTNIIPESELADIYFTKDEDHLQKTLDRVYGDGFYTKNLALFETLQYTSDPKQELQLANTIMQKIGGPRLKESDLFSTDTTL